MKSKFRILSGVVALAALLVIVGSLATVAHATPPVLDPVAYSVKASNTNAQLCSGTDSSQRLVGVSLMATTGADTLTQVRLYNGTSTSGTLIYSRALAQNGSIVDAVPKAQCGSGIYVEFVSGHADVTALVQTGTPY